jgi:group I intron endonuclease
MNSGVYIIRNTVNGKVYVGSTKNFDRRFSSHRWMLEKNKHHSTKLQRSWLKYGEGAFSFEKVIVCGIKNLLSYEQMVISFYSSCSDGYNILPKAGSREGSKHSQSVVKLMVAFQRSNRKKYEWKGKQLCLAEIAEIEGMKRDLLLRRVLEDGWDLHTAVNTEHSARDVKHYGFGKEQTVREWSEEYKIDHGFFRLWLSRGLSIEDCVGKLKKITVHEFARLLNVDSKAFAARIDRGWSIGDAIAKPVNKAFSIDDARAIRELYKTTTIKDIAAMHNVHRDTIHLILRNVSFKEAA